MPRFSSDVEDVEERIPPKFNFDAASIVPGLASRSTSSQATNSGPLKLNVRSPPNLQVLSPRARAVNASQNSKDKGKGRVINADIIELSDSSDDEAEKRASRPTVTQVNTMNKARQASTSKASGSQPLPTAIRTGTGANVSLNDVPEHPQRVVQDATPLQRRDNEVPVAVDEPPLAELPVIDTIDDLVSAVLEIVPDVEPDHVIARYTQLAAINQDAVLGENPIVFLERILHDLFETPDYPKSKDKKRKRQEDEDAPIAGPSKGKKRKSENVMKTDLLAHDRFRPLSAGYVELSLYWLGVEFSRLRKDFLRRSFMATRSYAQTYVYLRTSEAAGTISPGSTKKSATRPLANGPPWHNVEFDRELTWCRDWQPGKSGEISFIVEEGTTQEEEPTTPVAVTREVEKIESTECEPGMGIECGCCFSEYTPETMIQCPEGHMFCKACILAFCQERLGSRNAKIKCMNQDDCLFEIGHTQLMLCLPPKLVSLYERIKQDEEIAAAGLANLEECPFCDYKCVIENELERLFQCMNEECGETSCRNCKKKDHLPKTCAEADEDNTLNAQHTVEEAMTNALMRKCPKCQATFVKTDGCNKIACIKCKQLSCYICRKAITGYDHFNEQPGARSRGSPSKATKCPLWDLQPGVVGGVALEQRHHDEVTRAREEALATMRRENPELDVERVKVDAPDVPRPAQRQQPVPFPPGLPLPAFAGPQLDPGQLFGQRAPYYAPAVPGPGPGHFYPNFAFQGYPAPALQGQNPAAGAYPPLRNGIDLHQPRQAFPPANYPLHGVNPFQHPPGCRCCIRR